MADEPAKKVAVAPGVQTININVGQAAAAPPAVSIVLYGRHGHVTPYRGCCSHTGGGNIDVAQPTPDTVIITMTGAAAAIGTCKPGVASMDFDLNQCLEVVFDKPEVKRAKLTIEGRVIGLLRSKCCCIGGASAEESGAVAALTVDASPAEVVSGPHGPGAPAPVPGELISIHLPDHMVAGGENLSINDHEGPLSVPISAGKYALHQSFHIKATHGRDICCKVASAEFAPDPAIDPLWMSYWEPFHGAIKKDFGFQIVIRVADDTPPSKEENQNQNKEKAPPPKGDDNNEK
jgi:hypothetical protein